MLTEREKELVLWYRGLSRVERLAVLCWLRTGDTRLVLLVRLFSGKLQRYAVGRPGGRLDA